MLLVNSGMSRLDGQNAGSPTTHSAPRIGPATEPTPPMTATAIELQGVVDGEHLADADRREQQAEQGAAEPGDGARPARTTSASCGPGETV